MFLRIVLPLIFALATVAATFRGAAQTQGNSIGCNILWGRAAASSGESRTSAYQRFLRACPRDPRSGAARARSTEPQRPTQVQAAPERRTVVRNEPPRVRHNSRQRIRSRPPSYMPPPQSNQDFAYPAPAPLPSPVTLVSLFANGATMIDLRGGPHYTNGPLIIRRSVTLHGSPGPDGTLPTIEGSIIVEGGEVALQNVTLSTRGAGSALRVRNGHVSITNSIVLFNGVLRSPRSNEVADAVVAVEGGYVNISGSVIGPGYSQAASVYGGTLIIRDSTVRNTGGLAIGVLGGLADVRNSTITGSTGLFIARYPTIAFYNNRFETDVSGVPIIIGGAPRGSFLSNRFPYNFGAPWLCVERTVSAVNISGNTRGSGVALPVVNARIAC
jgi:hypothetical protein